MQSSAQVGGNADPGPHRGQGEPVSCSGLIEHLTPEFAAAATRLIQSGDVYFFPIRTRGGAVAGRADDATPFAHRQANFSVVALGTNRARLAAAWDDLYQHLAGVYLSCETDQRPERLDDAFPPATLARLRKLKRRYDPENVFRDNFNVSPAASDPGAVA